MFFVSSLLGLGMIGGGVAGGVRVLLRDGMASRWWLGGLFFVAGHALMAWSVNFERRSRGKAAVEEKDRGKEYAKIFLYGLVEILTAGTILFGVAVMVNGLLKKGTVGLPWWLGAVVAATGIILANGTAKWLGFLKPKGKRKPRVSARARDGRGKDAQDGEDA